MKTRLTPTLAELAETMILDARPTAEIARATGVCTRNIQLKRQRMRQSGKWPHVPVPGGALEPPATARVVRIAPKLVKQYKCDQCRQVVYLRPCVLCAAREFRKSRERG